MTPADLPGVMAIEREIYPFPWTPGNFSDSIEAGYQCWVCEREGGLPVAYAVVMWIPDEVHLLNLSVALPWQGRGLGRAVLEWLCVGAAHDGALGMLLEVRPSNEAAHRLYQRCGFDRIGVRRHYYPAADGQREDAWVMFRPLEPGFSGFGRVPHPATGPAGSGRAVDDGDAIGQAS